MQGLSVKIDTTEVRRLMKGLPREMPFAISLALTWTARYAARQLAGTMRQHFTLRTDELPKRIGYLMTRRGAQEVIVGSKSWYMALQADGGTRTDMTGHGVWVPVAMRKNKQTITRPSRWPGRVDDPGKGGQGYTGRVFTGRVKTKKGPMLGTWRRVDRLVNSAGDTKRGLQLLYWQRESVKIPRRWPLARIVEGAVAKRWDHYALLAVEWVFQNPNKRAARPPLTLGWMTPQAFRMSLAEAQAKD